MEYVNSHAISLGDGADVKSGSNSTSDGGLLFVICKAFSGEVSATPLGDLKNDRGFDISKEARAQVFIRCKVRESSRNQTHRAASRTAFAVEEEVTFWDEWLTFTSGRTDSGQRYLQSPR
jgi:hypothetical protein